MKYSKPLFRILLVSGIILHSLLSIRAFETRIFFDLFSVMFLVYAFSWVLVEGISKRNYDVNHFGVVIFITVLGVGFLLLAFLGAYSFNLGLNNLLVDFLLTPFGDTFMLFCLFGGMVFLTVGVCGVGSRYCVDDKFEFSVIAVIVIPSFIWVLLILYTFSSLTVGFGI